MSYAERIDRIMIKSMDFKDLKAWAIKHLKKQLKEEQKGLEFSKSLAIEEIFEKAVYFCHDASSPLQSRQRF